MAINTFPVSNGDVLDADTINMSYNKKIMQVYTGTSFNSSVTMGTSEHSVELTAIAAADLVGATYVKIKTLATITYSNDTTGGNFGAYGYVEMKIQAKETGGAYADDLAYKTVGKKDGSATGVTIQETQLGQFEYYHTLTAGEKANGVQFKIFSKSIVPSGSVTYAASFTNIQTVVEVI